LITAQEKMKLNDGDNTKERYGLHIKAVKIRRDLTCTKSANRCWG
jgi:hypothetical protein